ncbi:MAG: helix-turn-helix domain-containing protein [Acidimicrobiales bacterium]
MSSERSSSAGASPELPGLAQLGEYIRAQRKMMELSQRELARLTQLSDPYVSQLERGMHEPSVRVLKALASALNVRAETLLSYAGLLEPTDVPTVVEAVNADPLLNEEQKLALLGVYRNFVGSKADTDPAA